MRSCLFSAWGIVLHDYRVRFGRTILGMLWLLLPLVALMGIAMAVGRNAGLYNPSDSHAYFTRLLAGLILWQLFADSWLEAMRLGRRSNSILRSVAFDRRIILAAGILSALVAFAIKLPLLIVTLLWFKTPLSLEALLLPFGLIAIVGSGCILACLTLPASLVLLDIRYIMPIAQYALLLATPIFYDWREGLVGSINSINPLTYVVPTTRDLLTGSANFELIFLAMSVVLAALPLFLRYYERRMGLIVAYVGQ